MDTTRTCTRGAPAVLLASPLATGPWVTWPWAVPAEVVREAAAAACCRLLRPPRPCRAWNL